jgi:DNA replication protein DnaC
VLFTLLAERYERRSLVITSNLVFSQWEQIFRNPMATAAAIDRIVHHSVILEFDVPSYRTEAAKQRTRQEAAGSAASRPKSRPEDRSGRRTRTMGG